MVLKLWLLPNSIQMFQHPESVILTIFQKYHKYGAGDPRLLSREECAFSSFLWQFAKKKVRLDKPSGLSHVGFGALGVAAVLYLSPMAVTLPVVILAAFLLLRLSGRNSGDRAIALISSSALAVGVIAVSAGGVNTDLNAFLFGSILSIARSDAMIAAVAAVMTFFVYIVFYHQIYASTFDPSFAEATGIKCSRYTSILAVLTAVIIVVGMRMLGSLLISSLIIFPATTAMLVSRSYLMVSVLAAVESAIAFIIGFLASYAFSLPAGASVVAAHMVIFAAVYIISRAVRYRRASALS